MPSKVGFEFLKSRGTRKHINLSCFKVRATALDLGGPGFLNCGVGIQAGNQPLDEPRALSGRQL